MNTIELIDRISILLRSEERKKYLALGLQPVQGQILNYLDKCNHLSDTPVAVAEYFGLTKGTVSQTLQVLERKGHLLKHVDATDRRILHLSLSESGQQVLSEIKALHLFADIDQVFSKKEFAEINVGLNAALSVLQKSNHLKSFGVCNTCAYFDELENHYHCGLFQNPLKQSDTTKICREHVQPEV